MAKDLNVGHAAPDFDLATDGGGRARLADFKGKAVVLYFYPKDDTSGCTAEAIAFSGLKTKFGAAGAAVIEVLARQRREPRQIQDKARSRRRAGGRPCAFRDRSLWGLEGKEHVRQKIFRS